jgi:hypothetical protein
MPIFRLTGTERALMVRLLLRLRGLEKAAALPLRAAKTAEAFGGEDWLCNRSLKPKLCLRAFRNAPR